ncbi:MAG: HD domain-containing protein [Chloroflexi bacterium]|nr:HD domain-containing protein [Chloroflexota bacterium]
MMEVTTVTQTLLHANQLKRTARTGWVQRGVPDAESVAAHSFGVVFTALTLAQVVDEPLDLGRLLALAALHDLPEALTTDIPTPAWRFLPPDIKTDVERDALAEMLANTPFAADWMALWEELHEGNTAVARLVHDADKLEMYLQARVYEQQFGNAFLAEFWATLPTFHFVEVQRIYEEIRDWRLGD